MSYTVTTLAKISGVSVRTLHFYDEIGLLKPSFVGENQYRYYEAEQLLMLQQILFFRELGFPLNEIKNIIVSNDFDKIEALNAHKVVLEEALQQKRILLQTLNKTLNHLSGGKKMSDTALFKGLDPKKHAEIQNSIEVWKSATYLEKQPIHHMISVEKHLAFEKRMVEQGIVTQAELNDSWTQYAQLSSHEKELFMREGDLIYRELVLLLLQQQKPESEAVQQVMAHYYDWLTRRFIELHQNYDVLGQLNCEAEIFQAFYDAYHPELLHFIISAMKIYVKK